MDLYGEREKATRQAKRDIAEAVSSGKLVSGLGSPEIVVISNGVKISTISDDSFTINMLHCEEVALGVTKRKEVTFTSSVVYHALVEKWREAQADTTLSMLNKFVEILKGN